MERRLKGRRMDDEYKQFIKDAINEIKSYIREMKTKMNGKFEKTDNCITTLQTKLASTSTLVDRIIIPAILGFVGSLGLAVYEFFIRQ